MGRGLCRRATLAVIGMAGAAVWTQSTAACTIGRPFQAGKPFEESYFDDGHTIFRGTPVAYNRLRYAAAITLVVKETYRGEQRDRWDAVWQNSTFGHPANLTDFNEQIGEDLVVVLRGPAERGDPQFILPMIVQRPCHEPAMQAFEVMEPLLRARDFVK